MQLIKIYEQGSPDVMRVEEAPTPQPGTGQALVAVKAIGVNFVDIYQRSGVYPAQLPMIPGSEGAGVVEAVGADVTHLKPGDRVVWGFVPGSYVSHLLVSANQLMP